MWSELLKLERFFDPDKMVLSRADELLFEIDAGSVL
jgi:hypothetical protein